MDTGPGWTEQAGTGVFTIQSNALLVNSTTNREIIADAGAADVTLSCVVTANGATAEAGVIFREQDTNNFWAVSGYAGDGHIYLYHKIAGSLTTPNNAAASITNGVAFTLSVVLSGTSIVVKKDGAAVITITDSTFQTATKFGIRNWSANANTWDDFLVVTNAATGGLLEKRRKALAI